MNLRRLQNQTVRLVLFVLALLHGCAPTLHPHTAVWQFEDLDPIVQTELAPGANIAPGARFTVFRFAETDNPTGLSAIAERQALASLIFNLESYGLTYVEDGIDVDLVVGITGAQNRYETSYVPPSSVVVPTYTPGQTVTVRGSSSVSGNYWGSSGWGFGSGTVDSTYTATTPGTWSTSTYTTGGYTIGAYYPSFSIAVLDVAKDEVVFASSYVAVSQIADMRVAFPFASGYLTADLARAMSMQSESICGIEPKYRVGTTTMLATLDGNRYFPTLTAVDEEIRFESGAFAPLDMIVQVDGASLEGASYCEYVDALRLEEPGAVTFTILRGGETSSVVVQKRQER